MSCHSGGFLATSKVDGRLLGDEDAWIQDMMLYLLEEVKKPG